jgi:hypothetical protein
MLALISGVCKEAYGLSMAEITKPTKGTKYIIRFFAIFLGIVLLVTLVVWVMSLVAGR